MKRYFDCCSKTFDFFYQEFNPNENGRCNMPHPQSMVYVVGQDEEGTDFICRCCKSGFRLFKMDFYEESTNSLLTGKL